MLFDRSTSMLIAQTFLRADMKTRKSLQEGLIVDENDYTSNLTKQIRDDFLNIYELKVEAEISGRKLNHHEERWYGADACIILTNTLTQKSKICLFEGKLLKDNWDYMQNGHSHFSSQLKKQQKFNNAPFAIWEQFYNPSTKNYSDLAIYGSTTIWHDLAYDYDCKHGKVWSKRDIIDTNRKNKDRTIGDCILSVCKCKKGKLLDPSDIDNYLQNIRISNLLHLKIEEKGNINKSVIYINNQHGYLL